LFCDIDHFKTVNDSWGHTVGDVVLSTLANRTRECLREGDTVGRLGGDEMVVLLPGLHSLDEAARTAEKIRSHAAEPIHHAGNTIHATLSIGATLAYPGESVTAITARADEAMYQAKQAGRPQHRDADLNTRPIAIRRNLVPCHQPERTGGLGQRPASNIFRIWPPLGAWSTKENVPLSRISCAAAINGPIVARIRLPPTLGRRTPSSAIWSTVAPAPGSPTN